MNREKQIWGEPQYSYTWGGNHLYNWAIPRSEILMNENLKQNEGWIDYSILINFYFMRVSDYFDTLFLLFYTINKVRARID